MIQAKGLTRFFGDAKVVDDVSFTVEKGEILGFLGPNAAGKSTTMKMLTSYLPPSSGTAVIGGFDVGTHALEARRKIGYLPENAPVYEDMSVYGFLDFCAQIRGLSGKAKGAAIEKTIELCFLSEVRRQNVGTLSKGFNQRVCFAQSILHDPEYLILDEPTDGLDPNQKHEVRTMIRQMGRDKAIILSTHILEEVDAVCTRAIVIAKGRIVADDTPEGLRSRSDNDGTLALELDFQEGADPVAGLESLPGVEKVRLVEQSDSGFTIQVHPGPDADGLPDRIVRCVQDMDLGLKSLNVEKGRLDEVFRSITTK